jgi:rRNA maturation RNase YbeY
MATTNFDFQSKSFGLPNKNALKRYLEFIFNSENKVLRELNIVFCLDEYLLKINSEYLNHDFYTDIITFDLSSDVKEIIGEIYISTERVKENAHFLKIPFLNELHRVMSHGRVATHLCNILHVHGYN